jgi:hypothetical protein
VLAEHQQSYALVEADMSRLRRLIDASDVFEEVPVSVCPACEQRISSTARRADDLCYVCGQAVSADMGKRRAEREQRALEAELQDIDEAIRRARADLAKARLAEDEAADLRIRLSRRLNDRRVSQLAPFMAALEDVSTELGRIGQQIAALPAIRTILARRTSAQEEITLAENEVRRLEAIRTEDGHAATIATRRFGLFADKMNEFLRDNRPAQWTEGNITISASDLTFYVGTRPWDESLGGEARVLFFLAYSYALLSLNQNLGSGVCAPGTLLLDNPYQQGLRAEIVLEALNRLAIAAGRNGVQVVVTQPSDQRPVGAPHAEINMPDVYEA